MAKLTGPLFSLGARGQIAKTLVFTPWKGLNNVRKYVIPANPNTSGQSTQRGYVTDAVAAVHDAQALAAAPLSALDITAYGQLAGVFKAAQTWFNEVVRQFINQRVASLFGCIFRNGSTAEGNTTLHLYISFTEDTDSANAVTAGTFFYGTSPTALVNSIAATIVADEANKLITGLTNGTKYYWQFRPTLHANFVGTRSGIYHGTPAA